MKLDAKSILRPTGAVYHLRGGFRRPGGHQPAHPGPHCPAGSGKRRGSRKIVLPQADTFESQEDGAYYTGLAGGELAGYVFETGASGYGGTVSVMTGIDVEGNITGVVILSHDETPGLGANATKSSFLDQYLQPAPEGGLSVVKYQTPSDGQIEAMTGATVTSTAVTNAVNQAIEQYYAVKGGA